MTRDPRATNLVPRIWTVSGSHRFPLARFRSRRRTHAVSNVRPWPSLFDSPPRSLPLSHGVEKEGTTWRRCVSVWTPRHRCVSRSKATKHRGPHEKIPRRTERENTGSLLNAPSEFLNRAAFSLSLSLEKERLISLEKARRWASSRVLEVASRSRGISSVATLVVENSRPMAEPTSTIGTRSRPRSRVIGGKKSMDPLFDFVFREEATFPPRFDLVYTNSGDGTSAYEGRVGGETNSGGSVRKHVLRGWLPYQRTGKI